MSRLVLAAVVAVAAQWPQPENQRTLPPPPIVSHNITVLRDWVSAINRHVPGEQDAALLSVAAWSRDDVQAAWLDAQALVAIVKDPKINAFSVKPSGERRVLRAFTRRQELEAMRELARQIRQDSLDRFLKRGAILHSDVAEAFQINSEVAPPEAMWSVQRFVVQTDDGQQTSINGGIVHWEFGRMLLDALPDVARDEFARAWYRAALAFKLSVEELDTPHFARAVEIFPLDPVIRFQTGCLHDAFAHPAIQSVVVSARLPPRARLEVLSEANELRLAESEFRRAIELDSTFAEARLRRGRVLGRQGKHNDALTELRQALPMLREPRLEYYARMFLGAEEEALNQFTEARSSFEQAARLYPRAQSPRVALSQLAHRSGNRTGASQTLRTMFERGSQITFDDDPWWTYQRSAGRMANEWTQATYRALPR